MYLRSLLPVSRQPKVKASRPWLIPLLLSPILFLLFFLYRHQQVHMNAASGESIHRNRLLTERDALLIKVQAWNEAASKAGIDVATVGLTVTTSETSGTSVQSTPVTASVQSASKATSLQGASSGCDTRPADWKTKDQLRTEHPQLVEAVEKFAVNNEILLALSNAVMICQNTTICWWSGGNILGSFLDMMERHKIKNYVIGALDEETEKYCESRKANWFRPNATIPKSLEGTREANRVSTLKYILLQELIQLGVHTLVADMDLVFVQNPFDHLHRDADVEIQSEGFDDQGANGGLLSVHDPTMGWGGGGLYRTQFTMNVGCAYIRSSPRTMDLVRRVSDKLSKSADWDQMVFNDILMSLSHGDFTSTYATIRVMDYLKWVNSKTFFKSQRLRFIPGASSVTEKPVMVHMNYHPDKHKRMVCIMERYFEGKVDACDGFPGGSEPGT